MTRSNLPAKEIPDPTPGQRLYLRLYADIEPYFVKLAEMIVASGDKDVPLIFRPVYAQFPKLVGMLRRPLVMSVLLTPEDKLRELTRACLRVIDHYTPAFREF